MGFEDSVVPPVTTYAAKEMRRWNTPRSAGGMRPDSHEEYPRMVYKARRRPGGGPLIVTDPGDEAWSNTNYLTVGNPEELERARREGWRTSPAEAIEYATGLEDDIAMAAAHRHFEEKRLSPKARAEAEAYDAQHFDHQPEIPTAPERKRRRSA